MLHAAQRFGARAHGITLCRKQWDEGRRRIEAAGPGDLTRIDLMDYRDVPENAYGKAVSIGMVEHVGRERPPQCFRTVTFSPNGDLLPIADMARVAERAGFEIRNIENLREHYSRTSRAWVSNLERNGNRAIEVSDERTYRIWRLYIAGSAHGFARGRLAVYQTLLAKREKDGNVALPPTREYHVRVIRFCLILSVLFTAAYYASHSMHSLIAVFAAHL